MEIGDELVNRFQEVTGATDADARFYLSSTNGDLEAALSSYYEYGREQESSRVEPVPLRPEVDTASPRDSTRTNIFPADEDEDVDIEDEDDIPVLPRPSRPSQTYRSGGRIGTMASIRQGQSSDEEEGQAFYAGGSERSGQQVLGPPRARNDDLVTEMFRSVRAQGGTEVPCTDRRGHGRECFRGIGYRLGQTSQESEVVGRTPSVSSNEPSREVSLKLWKLGFTVDDGPLQSYTDPASMQFLDAVRKGQVPQELTADMPDSGVPIHLNMEDRRSEDFNAYPTKPKVRVFGGKGHILGSPSPPVSPRCEAETKTPDKDSSSSEPNPASGVTVDSSQPTTVIRVRTLEGTNINITLNTTHTLRDLRNLIIREQPQYQQRNFRFVLSYPSRALDDESLTVSAAGICNACVMLR